MYEYIEVLPEPLFKTKFSNAIAKQKIAAMSATQVTPTPINTDFFLNLNFWFLIILFE